MLKYKVELFFPYYLLHIYMITVPVSPILPQALVCLPFFFIEFQ